MNRLPAAALVIEAADAADEATLDLLRRVLRRPGWLRLPLVLMFRRDPDGAARGVLDAVRASGGPEAVLDLRSAPAPATEPAPPPLDLRAIPADALRVLRAGAMVGSGFEADLVAALLDVEPLDVIEGMQGAVDAGVPVEDLGEGRFHLPEALVEALRASVIPSLGVAWHRRLARLLGGDHPGDEDAPAATIERSPPQMEKTPPAVEEAVEEDLPVRTPGPWPYADIFSTTHEHEAPPTAASATETPAPVADAPPPSPPAAPASPPPVATREEPTGRRPPATPAAPRGDDARAAGHLTAAGEPDAGAERYIAAAREAAAMGAHAQAIAYGQRALALLDGLPASPPRRRIRAQALLELGRLHWQASGPDPAFTLAGALEVLEQASAALPDGDALELGAEIAVATAGVCYDIGDLRSLERALEELTGASRRLLSAGDAASAARLLNDQAAVYVRMGDPVRATHLLGQSRAIFEQRAPEDPIATLEMAETDHLFARIPLHVPARPGRESDALTMGIDHALAAERAYRKLGQQRELGRVWETIGRLELRKGRLERARERLVAAVKLGEALGDLVGLARSTAALSELLVAGGHHREAATVLSDSVALNLEKGSPIGLAFNRRAFDALSRAAAGAGDAREALAEVGERLMAAEEVLGRMRLPGERDAP